MRLVLRSLLVIVLVAATLAAGIFHYRKLGSSSAPTKPVVYGTVGERHILVDQFGYRPGDEKFAVVRSPQLGYDKDDSYLPGARFGVRDIGSKEISFAGSLTEWRAGAVQDTSGDKGWWFDFSSLKTPGRYQIVDLDANVASAPFDIADDVYHKVLRAAVRVFYYQRSGLAKVLPFAESCWTEDAAYLGFNQDSQARDVTDRENLAKIMDLRGGWFDAGDTNKYVTFASTAVHQLLNAYEDVPDAFTDDFGIPESGNQIPDILDEVRWETDWFARMQLPSGGLALKVGAIKDTHGTTPSRDRGARYYVPECSSSTIAGASVMAHAAYVYRKHKALVAEAKNMRRLAESAWRRFMSSSVLQTQCDVGVVLAGDADWTEEEQRGAAAQAAVYLFAITGEKQYLDYVIRHHREMQPYRDFGWGRYHQDQGHALLRFAAMDGVPLAFKQAVMSDFYLERTANMGVFGFDPSSDLYRSFIHPPQYHWGSAQPRANYGNVNALAARLSQDANRASYQQRALETLHYFHGVNPFGLVMLSNMRQQGATRSLDVIYHTWFAPGTKWSDASRDECGPAPGYVTGGANADALNNGIPATLVPPAGQPPQKSFRVTQDTRHAAWALNEPGIYYQSAYVKLLSEFVR